jgi:DNA repair protein RecN (Recombination protein N)
MSLVQKLRRKYGTDIPAILAFCVKSEERLADLNSRGERLARVDAELAALEPRMREAAEGLSTRRRTAAGKLEKAILAELRDLGFQHALFRVDLRKTPYGPTGADAVEFGFAPNPGEPMRPLRDIASSGEISRVMLAVKTVLADHDRIPVLVFDEIDANIGGEIGNAVGAKMRQIGDRNHQVICITHLPQVAVYGRCHAVVAKSVDNGRTKVAITPVDGEARVREVARMLGGASLTSVTLDHAREMITRVAD